MEGAVRVSEPVLASGELTEVLGSLGNNIVVELEDDAASRPAGDTDIELIYLPDNGCQSQDQDIAPPIQQGFSTYEDVRHFLSVVRVKMWETKRSEKISGR